MGVTYYKLEQRYEGDRTKGCGLTSAEVDANFHFLRGYDIKDATFEDGILTLERVNCDKIVVEGIPEYVKAIAQETMDSYDEPFDVSETEYDPKTGTLHLIVNGNDYPINGFEDTRFDFKLYVGYGLDGNGTIADPVRVSHVNDTGFFAPVEKIIDFEKGEKLPDTAEGGDVEKRYITREAKSPYGLVYDYDAILRIKDFLEADGQGWRIPTADDWAAMLNGQEDCDGEFVNHDNYAESSKNGKIAGWKLKDLSWDEETTGEGKFNVYPVQIERGKKVASFWTTTQYPNGDGVCAKQFNEGEGTVMSTRGRLDTGAMRSLRLVRDAEWGSESDVAVIDGRPYETVVLPTFRRDRNGEPVLETAVWTKENVIFGTDIVGEDDSEEPFGPGYVLEDESAYTDTIDWKYYLNYYDSFDNKWVKKPLRPNDIVMVHDLGDSSDEEVIVKIDEDGNQILKKRSEDLGEKLFDAVKAYVDSAITEEATTRSENDEALLEAISALTVEVEDFSASTVDALSALTSDVEDIRADISDLQRDFADGLEAEKQARENADEAINGRIDDVESALTQETQERKDNDVAWGTNEEVLLGLGTEGLTIKSHDGEKKIIRTFNLNMGTINIKEMI